MYGIVPLTDGHNLDGFSSGDSMRDAWLRTRAAANQESGDSRTYVLVADNFVAGFYALSVGSVLRGLLPGSLRRNAPDPVSCIVLAQLAVSTLYQGKGLSRTLVLHAMGQALRVGEIAGCRLLVVNPAGSDLVGYYERFGFRLIKTTPLLMAMTLTNVREIWIAT